MPAAARHDDHDSDCFFLGLDLGQSRDFTALAALRRREFTAGGMAVCRYTLRGLKRWPLGTLYTDIVRDVTALVSQPPLAGCVLGVDRTGCGAPVVDLLRESEPLADVKPVLITAGFRVSFEDGCFHVPKVELVAALQLVLQSRRLEVPDTIPDRATLERELLAFRAKITAAGNETFEADWRSAPHDDEVLAVTIAVWLGEREPTGIEGEPFAVGTGVPSHAATPVSTFHLFSGRGW